MNIDNNKLIQAVANDHSLSLEEKSYVISKISDGTINSSLNGVIGAGIGFAISKYFAMSKTAQLLLSLAGFGIGKYLLDLSKKHDKFLEYDKDSKAYKINI